MMMCSVKDTLLGGPPLAAAAFFQLSSEHIYATGCHLISSNDDVTYGHSSMAHFLVQVIIMLAHIHPTKQPLGGSMTSCTALYLWFFFSTFSFGVAAVQACGAYCDTHTSRLKASHFSPAHRWFSSTSLCLYFGAQRTPHLETCSVCNSHVSIFMNQPSTFSQIYFDIWSIYSHRHMRQICPYSY